MRGGIPNAFRYHWIIQGVASLTSLVGMLLGILLSRAYIRWHQYLGFLLLICLIVQSLLGWRHHMIYLLIKQKTILSTAHVWLGRFVLVFGWTSFSAWS